MLNNKGFAVSAVLYTILIAFLLILATTLSIFSSSTSLISKSNDDLVNGNVFSATQVKVNNGKTCVPESKVPSSDEVRWYQQGNTLVKINSRYGTMYWPKDFADYDVSEGKITNDRGTNKNIEIQCSNPKTNTFGSCKDLSLNLSNNNFVVRDGTVTFPSYNDLIKQYKNEDNNKQTIMQISDFKSYINDYSTLIDHINEYFDGNFETDFSIDRFYITTGDELNDTTNNVPETLTIRKFLDEQLNNIIENKENKENKENPIYWSLYVPNNVLSETSVQVKYDPIYIKDIDITLKTYSISFFMKISPVNIEIDGQEKTIRTISITYNDFLYALSKYSNDNSQIQEIIKNYMVINNIPAENEEDIDELVNLFKNFLGIQSEEEQINFDKLVMIKLYESDDYVDYDNFFIPKNSSTGFDFSTRLIMDKLFENRNSNNFTDDALGIKFNVVEKKPDFKLKITDKLLNKTINLQLYDICG